MSRRHRTSKVKGHCNMCGRCTCNSVKCNTSLWRHLRKEGIKRRPQSTRRRRLETELA